MGRSKSIPQQRPPSRPSSSPPIHNKDDDQLPPSSSSSSSEMLGRMFDPTISKNDPVSLYLSMQQLADEEREEEQQQSQQQQQQQQQETNLKEGGTTTDEETSLLSHHQLLEGPPNKKRRSKLVQFQQSPGAAIRQTLMKHTISKKKKLKQKKNKKKKNTTPTKSVRFVQDDNLACSIPLRLEVEIQIIIIDEKDDNINNSSSKEEENDIMKKEEEEDDDDDDDENDIDENDIDTMELEEEESKQNQNQQRQQHKQRQEIYYYQSFKYSSVNHEKEEHSSSSSLLPTTRNDNILVSRIPLQNTVLKIIKDDDDEDDKEEKTSSQTTMTMMTTTNDNSIIHNDDHNNNNNNNNNKKDDCRRRRCSVFPITSRLGLYDVWRCCVAPYHDFSNTNNHKNIISNATTNSSNPSSFSYSQHEMFVQEVVTSTHQDGTMIYELVQFYSPNNNDNVNDSIVELHISCTPKAFQICNPTTVPISFRKRNNNNLRRNTRNQTVASVSSSSPSAAAATTTTAHHRVWILLSILFPNTLLSDQYNHHRLLSVSSSSSSSSSSATSMVVVPKQTTITPTPSSSSSSSSIPAKRVYSLTDNIQLQKSMEKERLLLQKKQEEIEKKNITNDTNNKQQPQAQQKIVTCTIPGLVPTLRPYQKAAVQWMLEREQQCCTVTGTEWELAWLVLIMDIVVDHNTTTTTTTTTCTEDSGGSTTTTSTTRGESHNNASSSSSSTSYYLEPLMEWKKKQSDQIASLTSTPRLYLCPFTGWLANSYETAKTMTVQQQQQQPQQQSDQSSSLVLRGRGGILAESMGLGKTVEVLACILAHPRPPIPITGGGGGGDNHSMSSISNFSSNSSSSACRRLNMVDSDGNNEIREEKNDDNEDHESLQQQQQQQQQPEEKNIDDDPTVGNVGKMEEFGDAEDDDHDDDDDLTLPSCIKDKDEVHPTPGTAVTNSVLPTTFIEETSSSSSVPAAPVTPDPSNRQPSEMVNPIPPQRWFEPNITSFGACICGQSIGWDQLAATSSPPPPNTRTPSNKITSNGTALLPIVFCAACDEPMHGECTSFSSLKELIGETAPITFHRMVSSAPPCTVRLCTDKTRCPCCFPSSSQAPYQSRATLIITPPAILSQWEREIQRHTATSDGKPIKVQVYHSVHGIAKLSWTQKTKSPLITNGMGSDRAPIQLLHPTQLGDADVVLMTFDSLMADLGHSNENRFVQDGGGGGDRGDARSSLRRRKRYRVVPSPLTQIHWWRICLDEAQRVETSTAKSARMALKLETEHRWAVSGTPIGKGKLEDLYGLLSFLRLEPFSSNKQWFDRCFRTIGNSDRGLDGRIQHLLHDVFWRSTKALDIVREQMGVPEQTETKVILRFSSIEKHFYDRQLEQTMALAADAMERENSGKKRKASQLDLLAERLHRLRAACCHPQVGSSGIGKVRSNKKRRGPSGTRNHLQDGSSANAIGSRVMSMDQILDRFIDDAKQKCEEAQRLTVLHTNAMAALSKLKVEAKTRVDIPIPDSDASLLSKSCKLYVDSLELAEENAIPTIVLGEAVLSGSPGFRSPCRTIRDGACSLDWKVENTKSSSSVETAAGPELWARIDFEGPARRITQIRARPITMPPDDGVNEQSQLVVLYPKDCIFQVSSTAVGGEFVDVASFSFPSPSSSSMEDSDSDWIIRSGFRTNKSKAWRLVVQSYHAAKGGTIFKANNTSDQTDIHVAIAMELQEATIASDPLQSLHCLHNAALSLYSLLQLQGSAEASGADNFETTKRMDAMNEESTKIATLYLDGARSLHAECHRRLKEAIILRESNEKELLDLSNNTTSNVTLADVWDDTWYDDFLVACHLYADGERQAQIFQRLIQELEGVVQTHVPGSHLSGDIIPFPAFGDLRGFRAALRMRLQAVRSGLGEKPPNKKSSSTAQSTTGATEDDSGGVQLYQTRKTHFKCTPGGHASCMQTIAKLSSSPTDAEVFENSHCRVCKEDWNQTGPMCRHCKIDDKLRDLTPDRVTLVVLSTLYSIVRSPSGSSVLEAAESTLHVTARAKKFFDVIEAERKEHIAAWRLWRTHLDLLNDVDELNQCKSAMRLAYEGEDVSELTEDQLNAVVVPMDVNTRYYDHAGKQAMALGSLRRAKDTLRYLKNQRSEQRKERSKQECVVCLSGFDTDRAVLRCGHSFHYTPCLEKIQARCGGSTIRCPLRCKVVTSPQEVMIASTISGKDGSHSNRQVKGSWGTKVTRLVSDVLDVCDGGEKSIVFSQWEDMIDIVEEALAANAVSYVRATSLRRIGECVKRLRSPDCSVLLLNVKNGAEGLTLLEATHVFMIEPLLNHGLDSQAINRIHRIGQSKRTFVHRYLIDHTIEMKIDKLRMDHQEDQLEDSMSSGKMCVIKAGGIDGGFRSEEELLDLLRIDDDDA